MIMLVGCASDSHSKKKTTKTSQAPAGKWAQPNPVPPKTKLGQTVQGRPIEMLRFGPSSGRPVLIIGGIHGSEPTSAYVAEQLIEHLKANPTDATRPVAIIPNANPDGLVAKTRGNANGVDVNRNFPSKNWRIVKTRTNFNGTAPDTEPESRAIQQAIATLNPDRIISIHSIDRGRHCNNYDGPARWLAEAMNQHNQYPVTATMGYPTPGSLGSWAGIDRQIPIVTLELPRQDAGAVAWTQNRNALIAAIAAPHPE
jgi:murein peptide amidase A